MNGQSATQQTFNTAFPAIQQQLSGTPGADVLSAATPIFQRNLQQGADILRQSGPRFASATEGLVGQQNQQALQDFNLFQQQVLESGRSRQLQALDVLGRLGSSADSAALGRASAFGNFALGSDQQAFGQQQLQAQLLQQLLGAAFAGGGLTQQPQFVQRPSTIGQIAGLAGTAGALIGAIPTGGASLAALPAVKK